MELKDYESMAHAWGVFLPWQSFPDPREGDLLTAPFGPGCYELRNAYTGQFILCGSSRNVAWRMTSLLPAPFGQGTRNNALKRQYVWEHLARIEYRAMACAGEDDARMVETQLHAQNRYVFPA